MNGNPVQSRGGPATVIQTKLRLITALKSGKMRE